MTVAAFGQAVQDQAKGQAPVKCRKCGETFPNQMVYANRVRYRNCCTDEERFWNKVNKTEDCWLWIGFLNHDGYGRVGRKANVRTGGRAHRIAWEMFHGPIPKGMSVMHICDVRACVRPDHLKLGTHQENVKDMWNKGRQPTKYTPDIIREIRRKATGKNDKELAAEYGTVPRYIWGIRTRRNWKDVS